MSSRPAPATTEQMNAAGKAFEPLTYEGAFHGFMREAPLPSSDASEDAKQVYVANKRA